MTKHLLAGAAALVLMSGVASAQVYPPAPPPPPGTMVVPAPPPPLPGSSTTRTIVPGPDADHREKTLHKEVDRKGNTVIEEESHQEGLSGSSETRTKTEIGRDGGTTTTRETTTSPR